MKFSLVLNDVVVPLEKKTMNIMDPYQLAEGLDLDLEEPMEMSLVSFKCIADMWWFLKPLKLGSHWWKSHTRHIPLLLEIRDLVKNNKVKQGAGARLPREQHSMVILKVRERILFVQNLPNVVILGLRGTPEALPGTPEDEIGALKWFIQELQKDIENLPQDLVQAHQTNEASGEGEGHDVIEDCIKNLQKHPNCLRACYAPSRKCFRVLKNDKSSSDFRVKDLKRKRGSEEEQYNLFHKALSAALVFLDNSNGAPLADEPLGDSQASE